jgi:ER membrane protein complex subunit 3
MDQMMDGMKKNMVMLVPQSLIMTWVTYFFSGFVLRTSSDAVVALGPRC